MLIFRVLKTLWAMLETRRRWAFTGLVALLFVAGILEMGGMLALFGYLKGLESNAVTGHRGGSVAQLLGRVWREPTQLQYVIGGGAVVVGVLLLKNLLSSSVTFLLNRFLMKLNERVSKRLFEGYLLSKYEIFNLRGVSGPANNLGRIFDLFSSCFGATAQVISDGATILMVALLLVVVDPWMTLGGILIFGVAGALLYYLTQRTLVTLGRQEVISRKDAGRYLNEGFNGLIDARLNNTRAYFVDNYMQALRLTSLVRRRRALMARLPQSINEVLLAVSVVAAVLAVTLRGSDIHAALPTLAIFGFAGMKLTGAMSRVSRSLQVIRQKAEEFDYFYDAVEEVAPDVFPGQVARTQDQYLSEEIPLAPGDDGRMHRELALEQVSFTYPKSERPALCDVSLTIPRGSFVSFCGPSGGGKSTLVLILMGLMKPDSGQVTCDARSVYSHIRTWHSRIGYVGQKMFIAGRTVRENVAFGLASHEIDDAKVWQALELASAADFVRQLPEGVETNLREQGSILSGGQRQRIIIARALYKDPDVIFFDEATAALDNITEREITQAIARLSGTKTIVFVAHRLSTIRQSDTIYVVDEGRIAASGTYDELLESSVRFRAMVHATEGPREQSA